MNFLIFLQQTSNLITNCALPPCFGFTHFARAFVGHVDQKYWYLIVNYHVRHHYCMNRQSKIVYGSVRVATPNKQFLSTRHIKINTIRACQKILCSARKLSMFYDLWGQRNHRFACDISGSGLVFCTKIIIRSGPHHRGSARGDLAAVYSGRFYRPA